MMSSPEKAKPELIYDIFSKERECIVKNAIQDSGLQNYVVKMCELGLLYLKGQKCMPYDIIQGHIDEVSSS